MLEVIFSSFWTWLGTIFLILSIGWAASMPIYWFSYLKKILYLNKLHSRNNKSATRSPDPFYK